MTQHAVRRRGSFSGGGILHASRRGSFKTGCLIALAVVLLLALGLGIFVAFSWKGWVATGMQSVVDTALTQSDLSDADKSKIKQSVSGVTDDFKNGKISTEQLAKVFEKIAQSPLLPLAGVYAVELKHVKTSKLPDEEKKDAHRSLTRFARGVVEKKISDSAVQELVDSISAVNGTQRTMKETLTTEELRAFIAKAKDHADKATVPDEDYTVDIPGELDKAIKAALGK
jgi:hypothetical protein